MKPTAVELGSPFMQKVEISGCFRRTTLAAGGVRVVEEGEEEKVKGG